MNKFLTRFSFLACTCSLFLQAAGQNPVISKPAYDNITPDSVTVLWETDIPSDSKVCWMVSDSNYQPVVFTDSSYSGNSVTSHAMTIGPLDPATIYRYMVSSGTGTGTASDSGYLVTASLSDGNVEVYFNHTVDTAVSTGQNAQGNADFESLFNNRISNATHSIDITMWEFSEITSVATSLIDAKARGVKIRFIYDSSPNTPLIDTLIAHGIQVVKRDYDTVGFSMHDKFWIFDYIYNTDPSKMYLWTGSTNVSHAMFHEDRNNIIVIRDESLCAVYTHEFEEMWGSHTDEADISRARFGREKTDNVPHILNIGGTRMEVYFAPTDSISDTICSIISSRAEKSLLFCMYKFNLPSVEESLHEVYQKGIQVSGVFDSSNSTVHGSAFPRMKGKAVPGAWDPPADVFIDTIPGLLHHKYFLVDADSAGPERIIVTGSYNWEIPAEEGNDENMLVIHDSQINNLYFQEFCARYKESGGTLIGNGTGIGHPPAAPGELQCRVYPNPFCRTATFSFVIRNRGNVKLVVFDRMGNTMCVPVDQEMIPGTHMASFNADGIPGGLYYYRLTAGDCSVAGKLILIR